MSDTTIWQDIMFLIWLSFWSAVLCVIGTIVLIAVVSTFGLIAEVIGVGVCHL